jgi:hypothetical protein
MSLHFHGGEVYIFTIVKLVRPKSSVLILEIYLKAIRGSTEDANKAIDDFTSLASQS